MIKKLAMILICCLLVFACSNNEKNAVESNSGELSDVELSYLFGISIGSSLKNYVDTLDYDELNKGLKISLEGRDSEYTIEEVDNMINEALTIRQQRKAEKALEDGKAFLEKNGQKSNIITTESGLQYEILKEAAGEKPQATDRVTVHYTGTLLDGTKFDSSLDRGEPATFPLQGVIPGWTEGIQLMPVGSKYKLYIPSRLGYGSRGTQNIGPNETLIFEVELLAIESPESTTAPAADLSAIQ